MDLGLYKFKKGDILKVGTSPTAYVVTKDETVTGIVWCELAGVGGPRFRFNSNQQDLSLISEKEDPYEYVVMMSTNNGDHIPHEEEWGDLRKAESDLQKFIEDHEKRNALRSTPLDWEFRIVKRRKAGKIEEL